MRSLVLVRAHTVAPVSGTRCYARFATTILDPGSQVLPPSVDGILAWSNLFRCAATFGNYLSYLRLGCELLGVETNVFRDPLIRRAKVAIEKRGQFTARGRLFLRMDVVRRIILSAQGDAKAWAFAMLCLASYVFLLRLPSEGIPIVRGGGVQFDDSVARQAVLTVEEDAIVLRLARRKNKLRGSTLRRACWCHQCTLTCPLHVLGGYFKALGCGAAPFVAFTPASALASLRSVLRELGVANANAYRTHDFRRGHARDMQARGATLREILDAGEWRSPSFLGYLDLDQLEADVVLEAHLNDSSGNEG